MYIHKINEKCHEFVKRARKVIWDSLEVGKGKGE